MVIEQNIKLIAFILFYLSYQFASAQVSPSNYIWYEKGNPIRLDLISNQIINFEDDSSVSAEGLKALKPQNIQKLTGGTQLIKLSEVSYKTYLSQSDKSFKKTSPLFKERGIYKALPGGIIVSFKNVTDDREIQAICDTYGLKLKKKLLTSDNSVTWLIETPSGLESLKYANLFLELHPQIVIDSRPNFWQPLNTKELKNSDIKMRFRK